MDKLSIIVRAQWDAEAGVYVATSDDVPGLVAEAATPNELVAKLEVLIPELLELNKSAPHGNGGFREVPLLVMSEQVSKIRIPA